MPDFSKLLKAPAGQAKKPSALPIADFPGRIKSYEIGDQNKNRTPYVRFHLALSGWPDSVEESDRMEPGPEGPRMIDLSKRQLRKDFYLTEDALWRLDAFIRELGIDPQGRTYEEIFPEMSGKDVLVQVQQYLNQTNNEIGNQTGEVKAQG